MMHVTDDTNNIIIEGLHMSDIALGISDADMKAMIARVHADKHTIVPDCSVCGAPCGRTADYDWESVYREERTEHEEGNRDGNVAEPSVISDVRIDILSTLQKISHRVISGEINADGEVNFSVCRAVFALAHKNIILENNKAWRITDGIKVVRLLKLIRKYFILQV